MSTHFSTKLFRLSAGLLLASLFPAPSFAQEDASGDPPEVVLGERLFIETRFAQFFSAFLKNGGNVNDRVYLGDPVMIDSVKATGAPLDGP